MALTAMEELDTGTPKMLAGISEGIGWMTFNQPEKLNAMTMAMQEAIPRIFDQFEARDDVRAVVVRGAGERAFVSGADISEFGEKRTSPEARAAYDDAGAAAGRAFSAMTKPVIGMLRGYVIGGGMLMAMRCDIRIAAADCTFGIPAARLGLGYGYGGVKGLVALVGPAHAAEILYSARRYDADEALRMGIVNRVVPVADLDDAVRELAGQIAANAPLTVHAAKLAIGQVLTDHHQRDLAEVNAAVEACFRSDDYLEGQAAFAEKRPPQFRGR